METFITSYVDTTNVQRLFELSESLYNGLKVLIGPEIDQHVATEALIHADPNSYGFRPNRSAVDAIQQCFKCLCKKGAAQWVLEGGYQSLFRQDRSPMAT